MIAIDTNILVHAHREDSGWHENVLRRMKSLAEGQTRWAIAAGSGYFELLLRLVSDGRIVGGLIHDTQVAALCLHHGVTALWSSDRDFSRFFPVAVDHQSASVEQVHPIYKATLYSAVGTHRVFRIFMT